MKGELIEKVPSQCLAGKSAMTIKIVKPSQGSAHVDMMNLTGVGRQGDLALVHGT